MRFNQPSYSQMGVGAGPNSYFPFNVAALASMSNQQLEVGNELHMLFSHSFGRQLIVTCVLGHRRRLACALPAAIYQCWPSQIQRFVSSSSFCVYSHTLFSPSVFKDLINQGRQKVMEATNALKSVPREPLEDIVAQVVSDWREGDSLRQKALTAHL